MIQPRTSLGKSDGVVAKSDGVVARERALADVRLLMARAVSGASGASARQM